MAPGSPVSLGISLCPCHCQPCHCSSVTASVLAQCPVCTPGRVWAEAAALCRPQAGQDIKLAFLPSSSAHHRKSKKIPKAWKGHLVGKIHPMGQNTLRWAATAPLHTQNSHTEPEPCSCPSKASIPKHPCVFHSILGAIPVPVLLQSDGTAKPGPVHNCSALLQPCQARSSPMSSWGLSGTSFPLTGWADCSSCWSCWTEASWAEPSGLWGCGSCPGSAGSSPWRSQS